MNASDSSMRLRRMLRFYAAALAVVLAAGTGLAAWRIREADRRWRADLLQDTTLIAWALKADQVHGLAGNETDLASAAYQRIKAYLTQARQLYPPARFLYLMRKNADGRIVFLADSEPADAENYSPPGQPYDEATEAFRAVFTSGRAATEGPIRDRWGSWISASVPMFHPLSDRLVAVVGLDVDATLWRSELAREALLPALFTALLILVLAFGYALECMRMRRKTPPRIAALRPEPALAAILGLAVTALWVYLAHEAERANQRDAFRRLAANQCSLMQQAMFRIGDNYLEGVARFFESSDFVDRHEFRAYTGYLLSRPYAQAWGWAPAVAAQDRSAFETAVRSWAATNFTVWGRAPSTPHQDLYPLCYLEPTGVNGAGLGFDLGSDPEVRQVLERSRASRMLDATGPVDFVPRPAGGTVQIVFRPVFARDDTNRLSGFALVVLRLDALLYRTLSRESTRSEPSSRVDLHAIRDHGPATFLATSEPGAGARALEPEDFRQRRGREAFTLCAPVFAFGTTYAFVAEPSPEFRALHPAVAARRSLLVGTALSALLTALVALITGYHAKLERQVHERTRELRASESSYHGLFNSIRQAIYIQDPQGRFLDVNDGAVAMYGYAREEIVGRAPDMLAAPGRNDPEALGTALSRALEGSPQYFEFWGRRKNGEEFPKDVWVSRGTYFGRECIIAVANDVSDRKRAEAEQDRLQAQLVQAQKMESIGRLAGGVAHDFNNMLQAILGNAALALEEAPAGPLREYLEEIQKSATRSADLTRQLLAFASRQTVSPRVIDLNDTISGTLKMLRRLIGEDIQLIWAPGADLWPVKLDPSQLDQILANLAVNARDAISGVGKLTIETMNRSCREGCCPKMPGCQPGDYVILTVADTGKGMDEETRAHLFEPFYTTKGPGKGVGLGLATVFGIVKQNKGWISVQTAPGTGTTFRICLPRTHLAVEPADTLSGGPARGGSETILFVEDEQSVLRFGEDALRRLGYRVLAAGSPRRAVEIARQHDGPLHLLVTDVVLPEMNGRELAQTITALRPDLQCLFMSGYTADVIAERGILDRAVHFIQKPFSPEALAARIRQILDAAPA